jgi:salicylate hydroxylase
MAVEDGTVVGYLLGKLKADHPTDISRDNIHSILKLYERIRKSRTTLNVLGAVANRQMYHMVDGPEQEQRDRDMRDPTKHSKWQFTDETYQNNLLGFDVIKDAEKQYLEWNTKGK